MPDDPFEAGSDPDTTPVGFYDGTLWQRSDWNWPDQDPFFDTFQTRENENAYGIFDLSGNVWEWGQDWWRFTPDPRGTIRGGGWGGLPDLSDRTSVDPRDFGDYLGFRVVHVPEAITVTPLLVGAALVIWRHRR
jgi:formylglycine-generating enzyme required for sulfatase activity